jgi:hypothetical protein
MVGVEAGELTMDRNAKGNPAAVVIGANVEMAGGRQGRKGKLASAAIFKEVTVET